MVQEIITYVILTAAIIYLFKKYVFKGKKKDGCDTDCGCH